MLFEYQGVPIAFRLVAVENEELSEITKLIRDNGGVISATSNIKFTSRDSRIKDTGDIYLVDFIRDCVNRGKMLDEMLHEYKYGARGIGCPRSQLLAGKSCCTALTNVDSSSRPCTQPVRYPRSVVDHRVRVNNEHDYESNIMIVEGPVDIENNEVMPLVTQTQDSIPASLFSLGPTQLLNSTQQPSGTEIQGISMAQLIADVPAPVRFEESNYETMTEPEPEPVPNTSMEVGNIPLQLADNSTPVRVLDLSEIDNILRSHNFRSASSQTDETIGNPRWVNASGSRSRSIPSESSSEEGTFWASYQTPKNSRNQGNSAKTQKPGCYRSRRMMKWGLTIQPDKPGIPKKKPGKEIVSVSDSDSDMTEMTKSPPPNPRSNPGTSNQTVQQPTGQRQSTDSDVEEIPQTPPPDPRSNRGTSNQTVQRPTGRRQSTTSIPSTSNGITQWLARQSPSTDSDVTKVPESPSPNLDSDVEEITQTPPPDPTSIPSTSNGITQRPARQSPFTKSIPSTSNGITQRPTGRRQSTKRIPSTSNGITQRLANKNQPIHRNFSLWEQQTMIDYLIDHNFISEARGNAVWRQMIADGYLSHRTPLSLNNNFRRYVLPNLHLFKMDDKSRAKFQRLIKE